MLVDVFWQLIKIKINKSQLEQEKKNKKNIPEKLLIPSLLACCKRFLTFQRGAFSPKSLNFLCNSSCCFARISSSFANIKCEASFEIWFPDDFIVVSISSNGAISDSFTPSSVFEASTKVVNASCRDFISSNSCCDTLRVIIVLLTLRSERVESGNFSVKSFDSNTGGGDFDRRIRDDNGRTSARFILATGDNDLDSCRLNSPLSIGLDLSDGKNGSKSSSPSSSFVSSDILSLNDVVFVDSNSSSGGGGGGIFSLLSLFSLSTGGGGGIKNISGSSLGGGGTLSSLFSLIDGTNCSDFQANSFDSKYRYFYKLILNNIK